MQWIIDLKPVDICYDIFVPNNVFIISGIFSTLKLLQHVAVLPFTYNETQWVLVDSYSLRLTSYTPAFAVFDKLFYEWKPLNLGSFRK